MDLARNVPLAELIDPHARNAALPAKAPASDANRTRAEKPEWLVVVGVCTHLACRLETNDALRARAMTAGFAVAMRPGSISPDACAAALPAPTSQCRPIGLSHATG